MEKTPDTPPVKIRPARRADLAAMVALLQALFAIEDDFTPDPERQCQGLARLLEGCGKQRCILVAEARDRVIGMATLQMLISTAQGGPVGLVEDVVVQEDCRGRGGPSAHDRPGRLGGRPRSDPSAASGRSREPAGP